MILLLDTSSSHLAIGVANADGMLLREFQADAGEGERGIHDARLAVESQRLMKEVGITPNEISRIGLILGPGSFTGLRIGLSFAKGLAFATDAALVPLTPHEVMFEEAGRPNGYYIVTPGYREDLFYIAESGSPREVRLITGEAIAALGEAPMLLHQSFRLSNSQFLPKKAMFASPSLSVMARLTALFPSPLREYDSLEPLYLT